MILRIFRARAPISERAAVVRFLTTEAAKLAASVRGLDSFAAGLRQDPDALRFVLVSTWREPTALSDAAGAGWQQTVRPLPPAAETELADHYEVVGEAPRVLVPPAGSALRILRAGLRPDVEEVFFERMRELSRGVGAAGGLVALHLGRRVVERRDEIVAVSVWRDWQALQRVAEDDLDRPLFAAEVELFLVDPVSEHFDALAVERGVPGDAADDGEAGRRAAV
ncbi:MAG TPA: hypothetical protein VFK38_00285 [Candidatus Limnocylindrales bacterium]|nr:hypothetical protein [Candidatus Limnocylindrales bacterium]